MKSKYKEKTEYLLYEQFIKNNHYKKLYSIQNIKMLTAYMRSVYYYKMLTAFNRLICLFAKVSNSLLSTVL